MASRFEFSYLVSSISIPARRAHTWMAAAALVLVPGCAFAADLPAPVTKAPLVAQAYDWTGFYVGGHIGIATGH